MKTVTLAVKGMSCQHCVEAIEKNVGAQQGVEVVNVQLEQGKVDVRFNPDRVSQEEIIDVIEEQGYDVET